MSGIGGDDSVRREMRRVLTDDLWHFGSHSLTRTMLSTIKRVMKITWALIIHRNFAIVLYVASTKVSPTKISALTPGTCG